MVQQASIIRPARLNGLYDKPMFIPPNSKDYLVEVDMGFAVNPLYRQDKICYFLQEHIFYQRLILVDGKANAVKDDARNIVVTGVADNIVSLNFELEIYPPLPAAAIETQAVPCFFLPEIGTEIIIRDKTASAIFYHFSCSRIIYKATRPSALQLKLLGKYSAANLPTIFRKWHSTAIDSLDNIY